MKKCFKFNLLCILPPMVEQEGAYTTGKVELDDIKIGRLLRYYRTAASYSMQDLAKQVDVSHQQLQKYEAGINRISASKLFRIARILLIPISRFDPLYSDRPAGDAFQSPHAFKMATQFEKIKDPKLRKHILNLIANMTPCKKME